MTDRELLEAAARAAGEWPSPEPFEHILNRWNPLDDDGDALRQWHRRSRHEGRSRHEPRD